MASKATATTALVSLNLVFFTLVSSTPVIPSMPVPTSTPNYKPTTEPAIITPSCPKDALELEECANTVKSWLNGVQGTSPTPCCSAMLGLVDHEAAVCLCCSIKASVLGIHMNVNVPYIMSTLMNYCGRGVPTGYQCT